jgi:hypothetical protein
VSGVRAAGDPDPPDRHRRGLRRRGRLLPRRRRGGRRRRLPHRRPPPPSGQRTPRPERPGTHRRRPLGHRATVAGYRCRATVPSGRRRPRLRPRHRSVDHPPETRGELS